MNLTVTYALSGCCGCQLEGYWVLIPAVEFVYVNNKGLARAALSVLAFVVVPITYAITFRNNTNVGYYNCCCRNHQ
jgi:hypothetical protein